MGNKLTKILFLTLGATGAYLLNYFYIESILIPDPCYYHNRDAGLLFNLFYDKPISNGGHPFPSVLNFFFTIAVGLFGGWIGYKFMARRRYAST